MSKRVAKPSPGSFKIDNYESATVTKAEILELKDAFDLLDPTGKAKLDPVCTPSLT